MKISKEEKFRSLPGLNSDYNMVRFTIDCNFYEARKLRSIIKKYDEKNVIDTFEYTDPNIDNDGLKWTKLFTSGQVKSNAFKDGKFRVENWIWGLPGEDDGWATITRWVHFVGLELKPKIILRLGGMCELRKVNSMIIHERFLGEYYEPEAPCKTKRI